MKQLNDVVEVPTAAISYGTNGQATVTKVVNGTHVVTNVTVGAAESGETQITSGVTSGDKVLEKEITFKGIGGGAGGILGGAGTAGRTGGFGGRFSGGGAGGFTGGGAGGFTGAGGFGG